MGKNVKRLIEQFVPENYKLDIKINSTDITFEGKVVIAGKKVGRPSKRITFHQNGVDIKSAKITKLEKSGKSEIKVDRINRQNKLHEVRLHSDTIIYPGDYQVEIIFGAKINDSMNGIYPCYYEYKDQKKKLFATQFESHHAREVFPCIDEPEAKATFNLKLITEKGLEVLSNTEVKSQKFKDNWQETLFQQTPIMSSYLLAFVVGEMQCVEAKSKNGTLVRSWATLAQPKTHLNYANEEAVKILDFFEEYFDTPFPLNKLDQVALPDFESAAMENWGLITYREVVLLADPKNRSLPSEQTTSMVIAHELSHQWFGNLVTMKWWDDLWLNESFASIMEHLPLDYLHPDWHQWEQYASYDITLCSNRDIYSDVQSVGISVRHPDEITTIFDPAIVYAKGGRLIKMMREYIGEEAFRTALKNYFKKHAYKNTYRDDLWREMSKASGKDIQSLMTPWLTQSGLPVVKISGEKNGQRQISQSRFVLDNDNDKSIWPIPLLCQNCEVQILDKNTANIKSVEVPLINPHGSGHYITHYSDDKDFAQIIKKIKKDPSLSEARINTLNDLILLARRGDDSLIDALRLVQELGDESREAVWSIMARVIALASNLGEENKTVEEGLKKLRYKLAHKNYEKLGWEDKKEDDPNTKLLRSTMIGLMLSSENKKILEEVRDIFVNTKNIEDLPSDRRGFVVSNMVRNFPSDKLIDDLIEKYQKTPDADLQNTICSSLTSTKSDVTAKYILNKALGAQGFVRNQDVFRWFAYFMRNRYTRKVTWDWMKTNWKWIESNFGNGKHFTDFVIYSAGPLQTEEWQKEFDSFFDKLQKNIMLERDIKISKSEISARIAWRNRELVNLEKFFKSLL